MSDQDQNRFKRDYSGEGDSWAKGIIIVVVIGLLFTFIMMGVNIYKQSQINAERDQIEENLKKQGIDPEKIHGDR